MRNRTLFWVAAAGLLLAGQTAFAFHRPGVEKGSGAQEVKSMDANCDRRLSREEHAAGARRLFLWLGADHDDFVTAGEMDAVKAANGASDAGERSSAEKIAMLDRDHDARLSSAEHADGAAAMFERMDTDSDGLLTAEEIQRGHDELLRKS
jgi:Ca2+-binding EF-hand superfamily protein